MLKYANCHGVTVCSETGPPAAGRIALSHCGHRTGRLGSGDGADVTKCYLLFKGDMG